MSTSSEKSPSGDGKRRPRRKPPSQDAPAESDGTSGPIDIPASISIQAIFPLGTHSASHSPKFPGFANWGWLAGLTVLGAVLAGLWLANRQLTMNAKLFNSYQIAFATIQCQTPHSMGREAFLDEVRYLGKESFVLQLLDADLTSRLAAAFRSHPWVAEVLRVEVAPAKAEHGLIIPGKVEVGLRFRSPVLRVPIEGDGLPGAPMEREVDSLGTLLPTRISVGNIPELASRRKAPTIPGKTWENDKVVRDAARLAGVLARYSLLPQVKQLRSVGAGWELETIKGSVFWGRTPEFETAGEPSPKDKCQRLQQWLSASAITAAPDLARAN
ncbi:MAG: hypothetical protein NTV55_16755 [Planctomycetota bacterium]|nr:hypothetical protein [Planctomycetota bacterium]